MDQYFIGRLFQHRLHQADIKRVLSQLSDQEREKFLDQMADIVGKLSALLEVSNRVSDTLSLDVLLSRMIEIISNVTAADRSTLFLNDPETGELFSRVAQGELTTEIRIPNTAGIAGDVFTTGRAEIIPDAYADPRFNPEVDKSTGYQTRNILCAPVRTKQHEIIGVAQVLNKIIGEFTEDDLAMLEAIATQAAAALLNAQLHEQIQRARREEAKLLQVSSALARELNLERLLQMIMSTAAELLNADRCTLFLYDAATGELWSRTAQGIQSTEIRFPAHLGIAGSVFTTQQTINIPDAYADPRFNREVDRRTGYRTHSILCMPVSNREGRAIGAAQVLNKKGGPFDARDEKRLAAFSSQASVAIENAQLFEDVLNMKNYNESMLESMTSGVIALSDKGEMVKLNTAACRLLNVAPEECAGLFASDFFIGENQWMAEAVDRSAQTGQMDLTVDADLVRSDGSTAAINLSIVPLIDVKGGTLGSLMVMEDITQERRLKGAISRYMTKEVAEKLLAEGEEALGGQALNAAVLFSDIRSFTAISEKIGPQATVTMLNEYFSIMVDIVFRYHGVLDKYIGDAIMAVFGAPVTSGRDSENAVRAASDMMAALAEFNRGRLAQGQTPLNIGVGICTDEVVSGNIGSLKRMDYTVIGDGVNLAARLESATKYYGVQVLITESTYQFLESGHVIREIDRLRVKGKSRPVAIYEVMDHLSPEEHPRLDELLAHFQSGLAFYNQKRFEGALKAFNQALSVAPQDSPSRIYADRCRIFLETPPPDDWDGVFVMAHK